MHLYLFHYSIDCFGDGCSYHRQAHAEDSYFGFISIVPWSVIIVDLLGLIVLVAACVAAMKLLKDRLAGRHAAQLSGD